MVNVRFYRLETLPSFVLEKHNGIFVHVTETMKNITWKPTVGNEVNPSTLWMEPEKSGESVERINLVKWLSTRRITEIESGLWFGGENGWELLSNDTTSGAIDAAIDAKIATLHVDGYAQATITTATDSSTLTIKGIKEDNGIIGTSAESKNLNIAIDGVYDESTNKIATKSTVTTAIEALDVQTVQAVTTAPAQDNAANTVLTFKGIKETDGIISQGDGATTFIVGDAKLKIQIGSNEAGAFEVFSANAQSDGAIKLNENVFTKNGDVISVITPTAVTSDNRLVTEQDIASLGGAMHYKGPLTGAGSWPSTVAAGDVYIVTTSFTHSGESNPFEVGDMIVFNSTSASDYTVVQSNITLGIKSGQIAKNDGDLVNGNLVVATGTGIKTTNISASVLEGTNSNRDLAYGNVAGGITITDSLTVLGKDLGKTINITSNNKSIEIAKKTVEGVDTGVELDLVWNTIME